jgi:hypothetical protein
MAPASEQSDLTLDIQYASTTTAISAHADTATPAIYKTTTAPEQFNRVADTCHTIAQPPPIQNQLELETATSTTMDSNNTIATIEQ